MKQQKYFNAKFDVALISDMARRLDLDDKIVELLFSRGLTTEQQIKNFLNPSALDLHDPFLLSGMKEATERITEAIEKNEKILVFGDYDVDGISATAIILKTLSKMGVHADYYLPNRYTDNYGLTKEVIDKVNEKFSPNLIITVDCGICCAQEVDYAETLGIDVIVTDHHEIPECLPKKIVVNAKLDDQDYPFKELCGTGAAFKLSQALLGYEKSEEYLPIAAIATIADIVSLTGENRAIVTMGLKLLDKYLPAGLKMLFKENKLNLKTVNSTDIAFKIAPKINSSGRMGEASDSLLLYLENDPAVLKKLIEKINDYNTKRQKIGGEIFEDCIKMLKNKNMANERCIILSSPNWDSGILGIVCAKLVETYSRPAFLFSENNGILKGSARSLDDINVHEMLTSMNDILETFGGHKMAAGLTLKAEHLPIFIEKVNSFIFTKVSSKLFTPIYYYDLDVDLSDLTDKFYNDMQKLEPFGLDNAKPLLKLNSSEVKITPLKNFASHYNIAIGKNLNLIYFNCQEKYFLLKYATNKNFIFEIQTKADNQLKGIVKNFDGGFELDKSFSASLDAFTFEQLNYLKNKSNVSLKQYSSADLVKFIANCESNPFGTIFVTTRSATYRNFTQNYNSENIKELFVFNNSSDTGYNALYLYPTELTIFKNYQNIIFLDPVLDKSYLAEIKKYTTGEIYTPTETSFDKKIFTSINLSKGYMLDFFNKLKSLNAQQFSNKLHLYNNLVKTHKISFDNFYIYILVFMELNLIKLTQGDLLTLQVNSSKKIDFNHSSIYNLANYLNQISK